MPLSLILVEAIIDITVVDVVLNFQKFICTTLGFTGNCEIFKVLAIAKPLQCLSPFDKLNARTKRKTEYCSFLKHPQNTIHRKIQSIVLTIDNDDHSIPIAATTAAAMTASKQ